MNDIIIVGAGGHAAELDEYIKHSQLLHGNEDLRIIGFLDDEPDNYARYKFSAPFIGSIKEHRVNQNIRYIIGIASLEHRRRIVESLKAEGARFVSFVHSNAYVSSSAALGEGTIIGPNVTIGPNVKVGKFTLINSRCSMGHDTRVGAYNLISPNVCFSGFTEVGDENLFGINSATIPGIRIGNKNKIAAGMIIDTNIGDNNVVFYRFKERVFTVVKSS